MIYAIEAIGSGFIKFGRAASIGNRLKALETASPHELHILAAIDWPDGAETAIHKYLAPHAERGEWFRDSEATQQVILWMRADCLDHLKDAIAKAVALNTQRRIWRLTRAERRKKREAKKSSPEALSIARAQEDWRGITDPIMRRRAQRLAWWDGPRGIRAAQQLAGTPLDVVVDQSIDVISSDHASQEVGNARISS